MNRIVRSTTLANRSILGVASVATLALGGYLASSPTPKAGGAAPSPSSSSTAQPSSSPSSQSASSVAGNSGGFAQPAPVQQTQQTPQSTTRAS